MIILDSRENEFQILIGTLQNSLLSERLKVGILLEKIIRAKKPINSLATILKLAMKDQNSMVYITLLEYLAKNKQYLQPFAIELFPILISNLHSDLKYLETYSVAILEEFIFQNWIKISISLPVINLQFHKLKNINNFNLCQILSKINLMSADSHDRKIFYEFYPKLFKIKPKISIDILIDLLLKINKLDLETCNFFQGVFVTKKILLDVPFNIQTRFYQVIATHFWIITQPAKTNMNLKYVELNDKTIKYSIYEDIGKIIVNLILKELEMYTSKENLIEIEEKHDDIITTQNNIPQIKYIRCQQCNMENEIKMDNLSLDLDTNPKFCAYCGDNLSLQMLIINNG